MRAFIAAVATGAAVAGIAGCSLLPGPPPPLASHTPGVVDASPSPDPPSTEEATAGAEATADGFTSEEHTAMRIRARTCQEFSVGSGFMLDEHTVVTNRHVVEDAQTITLTTYDGEVFEGTASVIADFADLALVTVSDTLDFAATLSADEPSAGDTVDIVGYPLGGPLNTRSGPFVDRVPDTLGKGRDDVYLIKVAAEHGNSGSGVFDANGKVVGVLYATDDSKESFAVTLASLQKFLADESLQLPNDTTCD